MGSSPCDPIPPLAFDRAAWAWLVVTLGIAAIVVLVGLGGGTMRPYDEGLYGKLARNALEHRHWLYAVDAQGALYTGFSKPPLSILAVAGSFGALGVSLTSLRLPFALCTLATVGVAFAWGRRIAGIPFGVAWAGVLLSGAATVRWGRVACIEPMLVLFVLTGLWAYHESSERHGRGAWAWALVAAGALTLAVATKQVVVALAVIPIVALELWRGRLRQALPRLLLVLGLPLAVGLAWLGAVAARVGSTAFEVYVSVGVVERMQGYRAGTSMRTLNELSGVVAEATEPFAWGLGVAGLVLLVLGRRRNATRARRDASGALLLPLLLLTAVVVFENLSGSMRPWYAYDLVVPLAGGSAYLVAGLVAPDHQGQDRARVVARAVGGALTLGIAALGALADVTSQLDAAVLTGLLVVLAWPRGPAIRRRARVVLLGVGALALGVGTARRPELHTPPGGHETLMAVLAARGIARVDVDTDTRLSSEHALGTYYGPHAELVTRPPWRSSRESRARAYVTATLWPTELHAPAGTEILRAPGVMAVVGELDQPVWGASTLATLLEQGPLTFEAEHLPGQRLDVQVADPRASGGRATAVVPALGRPRRPFVLAHGPGARLPKGPYTAQFMLRHACPGLDEGTAATVRVIAGTKKLPPVEVSCSEPASDYRAVPVRFTLIRPTRVELRVEYMQGVVWFDRVVVRSGH